MDEYISTDNDGIPDSSDNSPNHPNRDQLDSYPPQGDRIGDVCDCDFNCAVNVDAFDVNKFLEDFGRSQFNNPCPVCVPGNWCVY